MGQNIVSNCNFDGDLALWSGVGSAPPNPIGSGTANWTNTKNGDNLLNGSGSAETVLSGAPAQAANAAFGVSQCVFLPGAPLTVTEANYGAYFLAPTGNPQDGLAAATLEVRFFTDGACTDFIPGAGGSQGYELRAGALSDTGWYHLGDSGFFPSDTSITASSAQVRAFVRTVGTTDGSYQVFFDRFVLSLNGTIPVELVSFSIE